MGTRLILGIVLAGLLLATSGLPVRPVAAADERCFTETGNCISGAFLQYWETHGGLAQQGLPLTAEYPEVSPTDSKTFSVQYFERAWFERHPENKAPYDVLLGLLGREPHILKYAESTLVAEPPCPEVENVAPCPRSLNRLAGRFFGTGRPMAAWNSKVCRSPGSSGK